MIGGEGHHGVLGDAGECPRGGGRGEDDITLGHEDVFARAFRHETGTVEHDRLVVARVEGFHLGEGAVGVVAGGLCGRRHDVVVVAGPRADLHAHALGDGVVAQVGTPRPRSDGDVGRAGAGGESHLAIAVVGDRAEVAGVESGVGDDVLAGLHDGRHVVRHRHAEDLRRVVEALNVLGQPEDGRTLLGFVGTDAFEDASAVMERVGEDMDLGVLPRHHLAVHPDVGRRGDGHVVTFDAFAER